MIVREIKRNPDEVLKRFDYFNDYMDTRGYVKTNCPYLLDRLDEGYKNWYMGMVAGFLKE